MNENDQKYFRCHDCGAMITSHQAVVKWSGDQKVYFCRDCWPGLGTDDDRGRKYVDVMHGRKPCPLKDECKKGIKAQEEGKRFVWDLPKQLELFV